MTRPHIIRADTIDLQDQDAPSAKDHTRQPARPGALGEGPPAPHQADALKHVELELSEQHGRSPRHSQDLSNKELQLLHEDGDSYGTGDGIGQDSNNLLRNAGTNGAAGAEEDMGDAEGDEGLDDDMMDKISSSPSIGEDGGYHLPLPWPNRGDSLHSSSVPEEKASSPQPPDHAFSSSPFSETPAFFPLSFPRNEQDHTPSKDHHHQQGGYPKVQETHITLADHVDSECHDQLSPMISDQRLSYFQEEFEDLQDSYETDFDPNDFQHLLLPADDPLLDNSFDDAPLSPSSSDSSSPTSKESWNDKAPETIDDDDDDTEDISFVDDSRFIDSGWGGECLRETEDIDFEFVYALHTFVATVEGQANATKGDTMVLLDDSNSYWWLVRVVKDSSIGYLPAEHIETPLERLARLNKHRNLDLSQTMLGDEEEKKPGNSLNPLKRAMQRRNTKTVQFTAPSYVEPSDIEYSSEEEEGNEEYVGQEDEGVTAQSHDQGKDLDDSAAVEPHKAKGQARDGQQNGEAIVDQRMRDEGSDQGSIADKPRTSDETFERNDDGTAGKSRKGTVRNTDSFFKDDTVETRKINLTPSLLRDDSNGTVTKSNEAKELKGRASLDSLEKDTPPEKAKDDKKRKEKRGMLGGMFKRKDKKSKSQDKELEEPEKTSSELSRQSPQPKESMESFPQDTQSSKTAPQSPKQTSKLQKSPPAKLSPKSAYSQAQREAIGPRLNLAEQQNTTNEQNTVIPEPIRAPPLISEPNGSLRLVQPETRSRAGETAPALNFDNLEIESEEPVQAESPKDPRRGMFSPVKDVLKSSPSEPKPEKVKRAKHRMQMDDFDSSSDGDEPIEPSSERESQEEQESHLTIAQNAQHENHEPHAAPYVYTERSRERLSESPIEVSAPPQEQHQRTPQPPPLMVDTSSQEDRSASPVSPISSPELIEAPQEERTAREETPASTAQSSTPTWSDASLRAYLEDEREIRDLLVVVHDKSNVKPARRDHPIVRNMYREENQKLSELSSQLDGLLDDYLARNGRTTTVR